MATTVLIARRVFPHRGRRVAPGDKIEVTMAEARRLLDRRLARRPNDSDRAVPVKAPAPAGLDAPPTVTPPAQTLCTDATHVWPVGAVLGSKCHCRAQRLTERDIAPAAGPSTASASDDDHASALSPVLAPAETVHAAVHVEPDVDARGDDRAAALDAAVPEACSAGTDGAVPTCDASSDSSSAQ